VSTPDAALSPELRKVRGPSALGGDWRRFLQLLWLTAVADYKHRYAGSVLGYLWTLLNPVLLFAVLYVVVIEILGDYAGVEAYPVLLLLNVELIQFFVEATIVATYSLEREALIRKVTIPQVVMPLASVLNTTFSLGGGILISVVWILAYGVTPTWTWLLFPVVVIALIVFTCAVALLTSSLYVRYRDVAQVWPAIARGFFFLTPVIYPIEAVPEGWLTTVVSLNPLAPFFVQLRTWVIDPDAPGWFEYADGAFQELTPFVVFVAVCGLAALVFSRRAKSVAEEL
jgi:ABC-2 type transport system permease protein